MPTYEYECKKCGHQFETVQSIKDDRLKKCPKSECPDGSGKGKVERLIGAGGGLLFKGSGFYITDYRSDNYKKSAKADKPGGGDKSSADKPGGGDKSSNDKSSNDKSSGSTSSDAKTSDGKSSDGKSSTGKSSSAD
ncbi:MAG TPA: zinc ribbon domain-containing protein [Candidatus Latescibacteria bacterium]|nr:FmdB family transcriptional regulator [Gemmatimonadaceae bacterium]HJP30320.1 zinc ribbon domain-containing protein [Candidatus Latescibacterota bacterium]|tara:strand:+ start:601 stop:1008 length:408 start_codon:yes stop_codon:yes gene_type:complete